MWKILKELNKKSLSWAYSEINWLFVWIVIHWMMTWSFLSIRGLASCFILLTFSTICSSESESSDGRSGSWGPLILYASARWLLRITILRFLHVLVKAWHPLAHKKYNVAKTKQAIPKTFMVSWKFPSLLSYRYALRNGPTAYPAP